MESATLNIPKASRNPNVRAYLAGGGATAALVAGAVVVFLGVAAFVGFNGLPFGAADPADGTLNLEPGVTQAAATAAAPTAGAVAEDPVTPSPDALDEIRAALPPGADSGVAGIDPGTPGFGGPGPTIPGEQPPGTPVPPGTAPGPLGTAVGGLEETAGNAGLDLPLTDVTDGVTGPLDQTVNDTVNNVGGLIGDDKLGDKVTGAVNEVTNGVNGLAGSLLGGG